MLKGICILLLITFQLHTIAQPANYTPTEIMLLGTFHFDNPGLDVAKFESSDVLSPKRQREIEEVVGMLKKFRPDMIFIEATPQQQGYYDSLLLAYKKDEFELKANEIYQLGFRAARELDLATLHCVDFRDAAFPFDSLVKVASGAGQTEILAFTKQSIDSIERSHNEQLKALTISSILQESNSRQSRDVSVGFYFQFLKAGSKDNHVGAYMVSEWWRRNMIIYENILKRLTGKEKRILVIFGSSHTALFHEFMKYNKQLKIIEVASVLGK